MLHFPNHKTFVLHMYSYFLFLFLNYFWYTISTTVLDYYVIYLFIILYFGCLNVCSGFFHKGFSKLVSILHGGAVTYIIIKSYQLSFANIKNETVPF
jgi:Mg2+/citrate symporter